MNKLLLFLLLISVNFAFGQITITKSDVESNFAIGKGYLSALDTIPKKVNIGTLGATNWDFSDLTADITYQGESVATSSTEFKDEFAEATFAFKTKIVVDGTVADAYEYYTIDQDMLDYGFGSKIQYPGMGDAVSTLKNTPADISLKLPLTFGTTWEYNGETFTNTVISGLPPLSNTSNVVTKRTVDAYGKAKFPGGKVIDVVRIKSTSTTTSEMVPGFPTTSIDVNYILYSKTGDIITITPKDENEPETGEINIADISWSTTITSDVAERNEIPTEFRLMQNYPNPFNPTTTISYQLSERSSVNISVFDLLGREVALLADNNSESAGVHSKTWNANNFASGTYIVVLTVKSDVSNSVFTSSKKMTLMK